MVCLRGRGAWATRTCFFQNFEKHFLVDTKTITKGGIRLLFSKFLKTKTENGIIPIADNRLMLLNGRLSKNIFQKTGYC